MLTGILFLVLVLVVAVLITVDVARTPTETPAGQADRHVHDPGRALAGAHSGPGLHAIPHESAVRDKPAVPAAAAGVPLVVGPVETDSFNRPDEAARAFHQTRREMPQSAASEAALRGKFGAMYVNLSRRSQALVERQLRIIEGLEHGEQDQQRLASLAKLNRIAMRMHRNSQNLLVLAGQEPAAGWNQPVTLARIIEAALAETENYERVSFEVQPDIAVRGPAVYDTVHLLVELLDNATSFSAAEMPVQVTGRVLNSGGALVDITDQGIGMSAKDMAYANQQLDNPPPPDVDVPKWMGLLVVARLAARHGIRVRLNPAESGGLTALVWFPDEILTQYSAAAGPGRTAEQRGAAAVPAAYAPTRMPVAVAGQASGAQHASAAIRPDPAWSAGSPQATMQAEPPTARPGAFGGTAGVVVPHTEGQAGAGPLPIFDEVESHWSVGGREASAPVALPAAAGSVTTSSAPPGPAPAGLPRRPSAPAQRPRTAPGTPPALPNWSGATGRQGRAAPAEEAGPGQPDES